MSPKVKIALGATAIGLVAFLSGYLIAGISGAKPNRHKSNASKGATSPASSLYPHLNPFAECILEKGMNMDELSSFKDKIEERLNAFSAKHKGVILSYYFRDLNNGMWIGLNEKQLFSPASLMKVPILIATLKEAEHNPDLLAQQIKYNAADFAMVDEEAGMQKIDGQYYAVSDLLEQSIIYSDNKASLMLMSTIGMEKVIQVEDDLNLHVKDEYTEQSNFVSVKNYAGVFRILYNGAYLSQAMSEKAIEILLKSKFDGGIRKGVPGEIVVAHKYGERDVVNAQGARETVQLHHFGIVYYPTKPYIIGVMTRGNVSREQKEELIADVSRITFEQVDQQMKAHHHSNVKGYLKNL